MKRLTILLVVLLMAGCSGESALPGSISTSTAEPTTTEPATTTVPPTTTVSTIDVGAGVWARVPHDEAIFGGDDNQVMASVAVGGPGVVAVGYDGPVAFEDAVVWASPDGFTWTRIPDDETVFNGGWGQSMSSVVAVGSGLVAVGYDTSGGGGDAAVWTSADGVTWVRVPHDEAIFDGDELQEMSSVAAVGSGLVAVGHDVSGGDSDAAVWTSPDGLTWTRVPHDETVFGGTSDQEMSSVAAVGSGLVAVGHDSSGGEGDAAVWTSPDGLTWTRVPHDETVFGGDYWQAMNSVAAVGPGLVAVGYDGPGTDPDAAVWTSPDGLTWTRMPHDETVFGGDGFQLMSSVVAVGSGLVAVGYDWSGGDRDAAVWYWTPDE